MRSRDAIRWSEFRFERKPKRALLFSRENSRHIFFCAKRGPYRCYIQVATVRSVAVLISARGKALILSVVASPLQLKKRTLFSPKISRFLHPKVVVPVTNFGFSKPPFVLTAPQSGFSVNPLFAYGTVVNNDPNYVSCVLTCCNCPTFVTTQETRV